MRYRPGLFWRREDSEDGRRIAIRLVILAALGLIAMVISRLAR